MVEEPEPLTTTDGEKFRKASRQMHTQNTIPGLSDFLRRSSPSHLALLRQMVGINSFTSNREGVNRLGKITAEAFAPLGFSAEFIRSSNPQFGDHLVLTRPGRSGRALGLISHLDTVFPPEEEQLNQFFWKEAGNRIYGPGVMDIKGGTVMARLVLETLGHLAEPLFSEPTWVILFNASEEVLSDDFGQVCLEKLGQRPIAALTLEAGASTGNTFTLVTARKGRAVFRVSVQGRGAHAGGQHHRGANAIVQLAHTIQQIAALSNYDQDLTFNPAVVQGGTVINRVPHQALLDLEMRAFSPQVCQKAVADILSLQGEGIIRSAEDHYPCRVTVECIQESPPWPANPGTEKLFNIWQAAGRDLGLTIVREERGGLSDANFLWNALPVIDGLGPVGDNAHCSESSPDGLKEPEYLEVSSFVPKAALNAQAVMRLIQQELS
jgi:glutamate carboxypeptidase